MEEIGGALASAARSGTGRASAASPATAASIAAAAPQHQGVAAARPDDLQAEGHALRVAARAGCEMAGWPVSVTM